MGIRVRTRETFPDSLIEGMIGSKIKKDDSNELFVILGIRKVSRPLNNFLKRDQQLPLE